MARGRHNKKQGKSGKKGVFSRAQREKRALQSLAEKRRPFAPLLEQIVDAVLDTQVPLPHADSTQLRLDDDPREQNWLEVGSGLGQLRSLLPPRVRDWVTHTELSKSLVNGLRERHPEARALAADVVRLPFESQSVDAILGLCVFDSLPQPAQAVGEMRRVLRPGGRFVHFLDAATNVEPILVEMVEAGRLPLPNFLADAALLNPGILDRTEWGGFLGPYHDLLSVPLSHFELVTLMLVRTGHPMAEMLKRYAAPFSKRSFDSLSAARAFVALTSDIKSSRPLNQALTSLVSTLRQPQYRQQIPFELEAHCTLDHFEARLKHYFGDQYGFVSRLSTVVYARTFVPDESEPLRAQVRRVGIVQNSPHWQASVGVSVAQLRSKLAEKEQEDDPGEPGATPQTHILREAAVHCFVAEKTFSGPLPA